MLISPWGSRELASACGDGYGFDDNLEDNHLMRMAGRFSRRLGAWAKANGIRVVYCAPGERKHEIAEQHLSTHEVNPGSFLILVLMRRRWCGKYTRPAPANSATWSPKTLGPT